MTKKSRPKSEKETRSHLIKLGKQYGFEGDLIKLFNKYDNLLLNCTNEEERKAISVMGILEVNKLLGGDQNPSTITADGKVILDNK